MAILPRYLAFKGDNGSLLIISKTGKSPMLEFSADESFLNNIWMVHEVTVVNRATGTVAIKYLGNNKYWQVSYENPYKQYAVMANFNGVPGSSDTAALFVPVKLNNDTVALRSVQAARYCDRRAYNFLLPRAESIGTTARIVVADPVLSRNLMNVVYHTDRASINSSRVVVLATQTGINNSSVEGQIALQITYTNTTTKSWNNSVTVGFAVTVKFSAGVPLVAESGIEVTASVSNTISWGAETSESTEVSGTYTVPSVPPGHRVRVTVSGTEAKCDVPFSYNQLDTLPDGVQHDNYFADGVYRGANVFSIVWEARDVDANNKLLYRSHAL